MYVLTPNIIKGIPISFGQFELCTLTHLGFSPIIKYYYYCSKQISVVELIKGSNLQQLLCPSVTTSSCGTSGVIYLSQVTYPFHLIRGWEWLLLIMGIDYGGIRIGRTALEVEMYESGSDGRPLSWVDYHGCQDRISTKGVVYLLIMGVGWGIGVDLEELTEVVSGKVAFYIFFFVHHTTAQGFLVSLALEHLLLNATSLSGRCMVERKRGYES